MSEQKKYEIAYHLSPAVPEGDVLLESGKIAKLIEDSKGMVRHQEAPQKRRLYYPIKKERNSFFGWITFSMPPAELANFSKKLKTAENLLRHLIVEEEEIQVQPLRTYIPRPVSKPRPQVSSAPTDAAGSEEKLDLEELDKKLEEILGK